MVTTYLRRIYSSFATHVIDIPPRLLVFLLLLLFLAFPITGPSSHILLILIIVNLMAIFACSWDLLVGRTGQMSLGHALFFGIGAYTTALLNVYTKLPLLATIPIGILLSFIAAIAVGYVTLRVRGPYLALVSLAFPIILIGTIFYFKDVTGGERGVAGLSRFFPYLTLYEQRLSEYYLSLILLLVSAVILYKVANSHTGIAMVSILDDELASKACGINVTKYKIMALVISSIFASLAGAVYVHILRAVSVGVLVVDLSFIAVIMTILGGIGTIYGPLVGAFVVQILDRYVLNELIPIPSEWRLLIYIVIVIILVIKWPRGLARFVTDQLEDLEEARELEERGPHIWKRYKKKKK